MVKRLLTAKVIVNNIKKVLCIFRHKHYVNEKVITPDNKSSQINIVLTSPHKHVLWIPIIFLISLPKHTLWVLTRSASPKHF